MPDLPGGGCLIYSRGTEHIHGVGVMLNGEVQKSLVGYFAVSERVLLVRIKGKPFDVCIIQVYAPTCDYSEEMVESFYEDIDKPRQECKSHDIVLLMGDMNAKIDQGRVEDIVGPFGLGERNERGERLAE